MRTRAKVWSVLSAVALAGSALAASSVSATTEPPGTEPAGTEPAATEAAGTEAPTEPTAPGARRRRPGDLDRRHPPGR